MRRLKLGVCVGSGGEFVDDSLDEVVSYGGLADAALRGVDAGRVEPRVATVTALDRLGGPACAKPYPYRFGELLVVDARVLIA